jgi:hypothetical protein
MGNKAGSLGKVNMGRSLANMPWMNGSHTYPGYFSQNFVSEINDVILLLDGQRAHGYSSIL